MTTIFEDTSLMAGVRSQYVQLMEKAVEPPGEAKPDYWIFARLAETLWFSVTYLINLLSTILILASRDRGLRGKRSEKGPVRPVEGDWIPI